MEKDYRTSALMMPTVEFLERSGLCDEPAALGYPLRQIRIIDATKRLLRSPEALFDSKEIGQDQFGFNFPNANLLTHFREVGAGKAGHIEQIDARVGLIEQLDDHFLITDSHQKEHRARLLVGADGKKSVVRQHFAFDYNEEAFEQSALVCDFEFERSIGDCSFEFHYENGPFTLVPAHNNKINLVWLDQHKVLNDALNLSDEKFEQVLSQKAHHLFGHAKLLSKRFVFPLTNIHMRTAGKDGVVLVGEAAPCLSANWRAGPQFGPARCGIIYRSAGRDCACWHGDKCRSRTQHQRPLCDKAFGRFGQNKRICGRVI